MIKSILNLKSILFAIVVGCVALIMPKSSTGNSASASSDKTVNLQNGNCAQKTQTAVLMFADEESDEGLSEQDLEELAKYEEGIEKHELNDKDEFEGIGAAEGFETVLDGKEEDFKSLGILSEVQDAVNKAKMYHNMKQTLPDLKKTFQDLRDAQEYHDKTVEYLQQSHECIISYLSPHYKNPGQAWFGNGGIFGKGTVYRHYDPEKKRSDSSASIGLYDDECPDDAEHLCYIEKLESTEYKSGIIGLLSGYYNEGKDQDALQETKTYLKEGEEEVKTKTEETEENAYTAQVEVESDEISEPQGKEVYVSRRNDPDLMDKDDANGSEVVPDLDEMKDIKEADSEEADENTKDPKAAEALEEETRKSHLMNWVWGAQVASDVSDDLNSENPSFGVRIKKFPLWNDQKEFYDQYIDGKYDNIRDYMGKAPMPDALLTAATSINDIFGYEPIVITDALGNEKAKVEADEIRSAIGDALSALDMSEFEKKDNSKSVIDKIIATENKTLEDLKAKHEQKLANLTAKKERLQQQLSDVNNDLSDSNDKINEDSATVASSSNTDRTTEKNKEYSDKVQGLYNTPVDVEKSPMNEKFKEEKKDSDVNKDTAKKDRDTELKAVKNKELRSKLLADELKNVKEEIENERREFVKTYSEAEENLRGTFNAKVEEADVVLVKDSDVLAKMEEAIGKASKVLSSQYGEEIALPVVAASLSGKMISCLREEAAKIAEETKAKMDGLKEDESLYYGGVYKVAPTFCHLRSSQMSCDDKVVINDKVQNLHGKMIDDMKKISTCSVEGVPSAPIAEKVFDKMCDDVKCLEPEISHDEQDLTNYFVGALSLQEDLKAPTPPVGFSSAPARDIFHFDLEDYDAMEKYYEDEEDLDNNADITITADGFLNSKLEMPLIWKYVLRRHTYGQKQFDLTRLLGNSEFGDDVRGDPDKSYIRSGIFPCYIDNSVVDVSQMLRATGNGFRLVLEVSNFGYTINMTPDKHLYGKVPCRGFSIRGGKVIDYAVDASPPGGKTGDAKGLISETSELGSVLAYVPDGKINVMDFFKGKSTEKAAIKRKLTFNASLQKAIGIISKSEDINDDKEKEALFYLANRSLFDRNQFGDYLNQSEQEALAHEGLMKIENQIGEIRQQLRDMFAETDIVITDDFDLLNEKDYKAAADTLDEQKGIYLNQAETKIQTVKGFTDLVKSRTENLLHSIKVLESDPEEIVQLNGSEDLNELADKIKNKTADNAVGDKYEDERPAAQERRLRQLLPPYCGVHPYK